MVFTESEIPSFINYRHILAAIIRDGVLIFHSFINHGVFRPTFPNLIIRAGLRRCIFNNKNFLENFIRCLTIKINYFSVFSRDFNGWRLDKRFANYNHWLFEVFCIRGGKFANRYFRNFSCIHYLSGFIYRTVFSFNCRLIGDFLFGRVILNDNLRFGFVFRRIQRELNS